MNNIPIIFNNTIRCVKCKTAAHSPHTLAVRYCKCGKVGVFGGNDRLGRIGEPKNIVDESYVQGSIKPIYFTKYPLL